MKSILAMSMWLIIGFLSLYGQHSLDEYLAKAKENSVLIHQNAAAGQANQLENDRLKAQLTNPQVSLSGAYLISPVIAHDNKTSFQPNPDVPSKYFGYDLAASNGGMYQALINVSKQLLNTRQMHALDAQSAVAMQSFQNSSQLASHDIEKMVIDQYLLCLLDLQQLAFGDTMRSLILEQQELIKKLMVADLAKQSDLSLLNIDLQGVEGAQAANRATYARDLMDLNAMAGIQDTVIFPLSTLALSLVDSSEESKYLRQFALDSANLAATQDLWMQKYQPSLNIYSNAGLNAVYAPTIPSRFGLSAGINFNWILYDGKQKHMMQEKTTVQQHAISYARENFQVQNSIRKHKILAELSSYTQRAAIAQAQLKEYAILIQAYKLEILQGQTSIINYLNTLKNMALVKRDLLMMQTNRMLLINAYNYWNW